MDGSHSSDPFVSSEVETGSRPSISLGTNGRGTLLRYAADHPEERIAIDLGGMTALYHRPSGLTHLVSAPVPELLEALAEGPADAPTLLSRLSARYGVAADDACAVIEVRLEELEAIGLVRHCRHPDETRYPSPLAATFKPKRGMDPGFLRNDEKIAVGRR